MAVIGSCTRHQQSGTGCRDLGVPPSQLSVSLQHHRQKALPCLLGSSGKVLAGGGARRGAPGSLDLVLPRLHQARVTQSVVPHGPAPIHCALESSGALCRFRCCLSILFPAYHLSVACWGPQACFWPAWTGSQLSWVPEPACLEPVLVEASQQAGQAPGLSAGTGQSRDFVLPASSAPGECSEAWLWTQHTRWQPSPQPSAQASRVPDSTMGGLAGHSPCGRKGK